MRFLCTFALALLLSLSANANISFDAGVNVEAQGKNSSEAKQTAMTQAHRQAFLAVCNRLTSAENIEELNKLTDEQLLHFIREVEVVAEKSTSNSYTADLNIKINESLLKQYLDENNMLDTNASAKKVIIVPVYADTDFAGKVLFEDGNVWRLSWLDKGIIKSGSITFDVIKETTQNKTVLDNVDFNSVDSNIYNQLRGYNASNNVFLVTALKAGADTLVVTIKTEPKSYHKSFVVNGENTFNQAIEQTVAHISNFVHNKVEENASNAGLIEITANTNLSNWLKTEKNLSTISQIKSINIKSAAVGKVHFALEFSGSIDTLVENMAQKGLYLQMVDGYYTLNI